MKKNIAIAALALLAFAFFCYGIVQNMEARRNADLLIRMAAQTDE
ncbi:MAG: hypothetical protein ACKO1F_14995 [Flammeovirgaceae bacterium]